MRSVIVGMSPAAVPAAPRKPGLLLTVVVPCAGAVRDTLGALLIVKRIAGLVELPLVSTWVAWAVYATGTSD